MFIRSKGNNYYRTFLPKSVNLLDIHLKKRKELHSQNIHPSKKILQIFVAY
jgi:hypothetical protein